MPRVAKPKVARRRTFLREWRKHRGYSQAKVSEMVEVDQTTISRLELGKVPYDQDILERLAFVYSCDPHELLIVNPLAPSPPKLVLERVDKAPTEVRQQVMAVVDALLKTGTK